MVVHGVGMEKMAESFDCPKPDIVPRPHPLPNLSRTGGVGKFCA
jgi:hypothetical protein